MWLFWLAGTLVVAYGLTRGGEPQPRFLVATGSALEVWHGADRESTLFKFDDRSLINEAAVSPDGSQVAFIRLTAPPLDPKDDIGTDIFVMKRDGSGAKPLVSHKTYGEYMSTPTWLPGGHELAYGISTPQPDDSVVQAIETANVLTGARRRLVENADQPVVLPGGNQLIVRYFDPRPGRSRETPMLFDLTTGVMSDLPGYSQLLVYIGSFVISPDGRQVAFGAADPTVTAPSSRPLRSMSATTHPIYQDVWVMALNGSNLRRVSELGVNQPSLVWSQHGDAIYVLSNVSFLRIDVNSGAQEILGPGVTNGHIKPWGDRLY
jgi:Tol biopolymer transport system component